MGRIKNPLKVERKFKDSQTTIEHKNCKFCGICFDLAELVEKNEHYIFESNIRKHLGGKGP